MNKKLSAFENSTPKKITLSYNFKKSSKDLSLEFYLDDFGSIDFTPGNDGKRWEKTCFEFFIKGINSKEYFEINISSDGGYNIFHFDDYRKGMKNVYGQKLTVDISQSKNSYSLKSTINLSEMILDNDFLLGASAVLIIKERAHYLALSHKKDSPDFHNPESFIKII